MPQEADVSGFIEKARMFVMVYGFGRRGLFDISIDDRMAVENNLDLFAFCNNFLMVPLADGLLEAAFRGHYSIDRAMELVWPIRLFWLISDYGRLTGRIIWLFFLFALLFATVYFHIEYSFNVSLVHDLHIAPPADMSMPPARYFFLLVFWPIYFSIVTMTTLGFGDMYAVKYSVMGHLLLTLQVLLGYVFLGALITRFAVIFTTGGPAGKFTPMSDETKQILEYIWQERINSFF